MHKKILFVPVLVINVIQMEVRRVNTSYLVDNSVKKIVINQLELIIRSVVTMLLNKCVKHLVHV